MKNELIIFAPAAKSGGALSVLIDFIIACGKRPANIYTVFVTEKVISTLPSFQNIKFRPLQLNSYFQRVYYDFYGLNKYICNNHKSGVDVLCISNSAILSNRKNKQWIMVHNPFAISKAIPPNIEKSKRLLFYTSLYPFYLSATYRKRHTYIVQRKSLEKQLITSYRYFVDDVRTVTPTVGDTFIELSREAESTDNRPIKKEYFFCPVRETPHKNIKLIHEIAIKYSKPEVLFVLTISEDYYTNNISSKVPKNIYLTGNVSLSEMAALYAHSIAVIFPSLVETAGLPLLETAHFQKNILVSDLRYAHDLLESYDGAIFLDPVDPKKWLDTIRQTDFSIIPKKLTKPEKSFSGYILDMILESHE